LSFQGSNADNISELKGVFVNGSAHAGSGAGGSIDWFSGSGPHGPIYGGGITLGTQEGASVTGGATYTHITPLFQLGE